MYRLVGSVIDERWIKRDLRRSLGHLEGQVAFWGCGLREAKPLSPETKRRCVFFGIRGPRSRDVLQLPQSTVLGDPGLLCPLIYPPTIGRGASQRTLCIPHIHDRRSMADLHAQSGCDDIISPQINAAEADLRGLIDMIIASTFVLAGSLHSAIIAFAYDRPFAFWDTGHIDLPFKWDDFARSVGIESVFVKNVKEGQQMYADHIAPARRPLPLTPILMNSPFQARPEAVVLALSFDGLVSREAASSISEQLSLLPDNDIDKLRKLHAISRETRSRKQNLRLQLTGTSVLAAISLKRKVRTQLDGFMRRPGT